MANLAPMGLQQRALVVVKVFLRTILILINNLYGIPAYLLLMWMLRGLLRPRNAALYYSIEGILFHWMLIHVSFWMKSAGYEVMESGDSVEECLDDETIVVANHQATGDVPLLMYCIQAKREVCNHVLWIQDKLFQYTNFGWVSLVHGDFFIQQGKETRQLQGKKLYEHLRDVYVPRQRKWIILFPEGGFLRKRRVASKEFARKNGYPVLEHVTLPRLGAMKTVLDALSPQAREKQENSLAIKGARPLKWFVDITIAYPERPLDLQTVVGGWREPVVSQLYFRKWPIRELPLDTEPLTSWLYERWVEKEQLLQHFHTTGSFPTSSQNGIVRTQKQRMVPIDYYVLFFTHIFFLLLTWFLYKLLATGYCFLAMLLSFML